MKRLLLAISAITIVTVFAEEAKTEKAAEKPAEQQEAQKKPAAAKTSASPVAKKGTTPQKKPAAKAKKKAGFEEYDAGPWKELDNRKGYVANTGTKILEGDLHNQPVAICVFDPAVQVTGEERQEHPEKYLNMHRGETEEFPPRFQIINVPSRAFTKEESQFIMKPSNIAKLTAVPGFPWYTEFGLETEPQNQAKTYPFYYVVSSEGKIMYAGDIASTAAAAITRDCAKHSKCDPLLGYVTPVTHADLCAELKFGSDTTKITKKLAVFAASKEEGESKDEAKQILWALDQSKTYWAKVIAGLTSRNPPFAVILGKQAGKTFPRNKPVYEELVMKAMRSPGTADAVKAYQTLLACKQHMPEKKADVQKAYDMACNAEKKCAKARKQFGERLPAAFISLENIVMTMKAELEAAGATAKRK